MSNESSTDRPILEILKEIKDRRLDPKSLTIDQRRGCVDLLRSQGSTEAMMASILKVSERTVARDVAANFEANAIEPNPNLLSCIVGQLMRESEISSAHLRRIANDKSASAMERQMSELGAWKVRCDLVDKLQSLGYLPKMAHNVIAHVHHDIGLDVVPRYEDLESQLAELTQLNGGDSLSQGLQQMADTIQRGKLSAQLDQAKRDQQAENN